MAKSTKDEDALPCILNVPRMAIDTQIIFPVARWCKHHHGLPRGRIDLIAPTRSK